LWFFGDMPRRARAVYCTFVNDDMGV
jgi:hypothetical protein